MTTHALEGPAGCGKTYQLMERLKSILTESPLKERQQVLALTFMHGSRRRLADRLSKIPEIHKKFQCLTIDSFAQRICLRWRSLAKFWGLPPCGADDFDLQCQNAAELLKNSHVLQWASNSFPITVLDEAQDLSPERLAIIQELQKGGKLLAAADEFQCLNNDLKPNPFTVWISSVCTPELLTIPKRTSVTAILKAADDIRNGRCPVSGQKFKIHEAPGIPLAAAFISNAIGWQGGNSIALITPTVKGGYATSITDKVASKATNKGNGPYQFLWELPDSDYVHEQLKKAKLAPKYTIAEAINFIKSLEMKAGPVKSTVAWLNKQNSLLGLNEIEGPVLEAALLKSFTTQRQRIGGIQRRLAAMTIHQAKNREFDGVIVIWPHSAGGSDDQKRRLLYNAVTRAKNWCTIIVQSKKILTAPPFG